MTQQLESNLPTPEGWMDEAMILRTQEVWSEAYGREVGRLEALEILGNVKWLAKALQAEVIRRNGL